MSILALCIAVVGADWCFGTDRLEDIAHVVALLSHGRDVTADPVKPICAAFATETTGYLLLGLHHPNVSLRQVIVERDVEIVKEGHRLIVMCIQALDKIAADGLLRPTAFASGFRGRISFVSRLDSCQISAFQLAA